MNTTRYKIENMAAEYISQIDFEETDFLNNRSILRVYLVTYSQVDEEVDEV